MHIDVYGCVCIDRHIDRYLEELKAKAAGGEELTDDELAQMQVPYIYMF